jgi:hypothetical protein
MRSYGGAGASFAQGHTCAGFISGGGNGVGVAEDQIGGPRVGSVEENFASWPMAFMQVSVYSSS